MINLKKIFNNNIKNSRKSDINIYILTNNANIAIHKIISKPLLKKVNSIFYNKKLLKIIMKPFIVTFRNYEQYKEAAKELYESIKNNFNIESNDEKIIKLCKIIATNTEVPDWYTIFALHSIVLVILELQGIKIDF